jgi:hypothetical protein
MKEFDIHNTNTYTHKFFIHLMMLAMSPVDVLRSEQNEKMNYLFKHLCRKTNIYNN